MKSETRQNAFFYGWIIVAIATLSLVVSNGLAVNGIPVFTEWIRKDLIETGAMQAENAQSIVANFGVLTFLVSGLSAPFGGMLIQRFNLKILMIVGCFILGGALVLNSQATTVGAVYASRILMGISLSFIGVLLNVVLVSNWFRRKRGIALGIVLTGTSFGGVLIPLIAAPLIANYGWRTAMIAVSLIIWLILLPAIIFLVKAKPAELNLFQDGEKNDESLITNNKSQTTAQHSALSTQHSNDLTLSQAVKTPLFWIFALCAALIFYPLFVSTQQLILYVRSPKIGVSPETAAFLQSLMSALSICGKFLFGFISDKFSPTRVMFLCCTVMFAATLVLLNFSVGTILLFLIPFGLGYGGTFVLLQRLVADYFGTKDYAKILGAITVIETIGASIGGRITGYVADLNGGDYTQAFYGVIVATGLALVLTVWLNLLVKGKKYNN